MNTKPTAVPPIVQHIQSYLPSLPPSQTRATPLFVAIQGPQGSGKTFLTEHVAASLTQDSGLRVASLSIDDLYLSHDGLAALAALHPNNPLLQGRGQPGTHDIELGLKTLTALKRINSVASSPTLKLPSFDKSQFNGEGDRVPEAEWRTVESPIDVVLFEGWCVGFCPKSEEDIRKRMGEKIKGLEEGPLRLDLREVGVGEEQVLEVNGILTSYVEWWEMFDLFVKISPPDSHPYVHIYKWRLQQEHAMKGRNGGKGMTDEQVKVFIDRYIPGYHFFGDGIVVGGTDPRSGKPIRPPWLRRDEIEGGKGQGGGKLLNVIIGEGRDVVEVTTI